MAKIGNSQPKITLPCYEGFLELLMWFESETVSNICQTPLQLANPTQLQDKSSKVRSSQDRSSQDRSSYEKSTQDMVIKDRSSQEKSSQDRSSQDRSSQDR